MWKDCDDEWHTALQVFSTCRNGQIRVYLREVSSYNIVLSLNQAFCMYKIPCLYHCAAGSISNEGSRIQSAGPLPATACEARTGATERRSFQAALSSLSEGQEGPGKGRQAHSGHWQQGVWAASRAKDRESPCCHQSHDLYRLMPCEEGIFNCPGLIQ